MHISEGVLNTPILLSGWAVSAPLVAYALKKLEPVQIPLSAAMAALFFVGSFIHVPLGPTSIHLLLSGLVGALIGLNAILAILVALFLQALLFGYGGLTVLGVNLVILAVPALISRALFLLSFRKWQNLCFFSAGFVPIFLSATLLLLALLSNGGAYKPIAVAVFSANIPLMFVEGLITWFVLRFLARYHASLLMRLRS